MNKNVSRFGNNLVLGALSLAPIAITLWIIGGLFGLMTDWFVEFIPQPFQTGYRQFLARIAALLIVVGGLFLIGTLTRNFLGRRLYALGDRLLSRIPGIAIFYNFFRQVIEVFFANRDSSFKEVVLVEYPRAGAYMLGFVTSTVPPSFRAQIPHPQPGEECVTVFIPTTPNPTSGWLGILPRSQLTTLTISPAEGMKLIVSGGAIYPGQSASAAQQTLLEKLEAFVEKP